jgi:hypothetical protein
LHLLLSQLGLEDLRERYFIPDGDKYPPTSQTQGAHVP